MTSALQSQRFCLRWNNHQSNLLSVFDQLLHDESFVDVTLAVEGRLLRAHKMVLSACSPYFQALFVGHPDRHPIVILKDVPYCDMRSLLDFMYRGEVSVDQDRLTAFLKVAESLRIKGLTEVNEERCDIPSITSSLLSSVPPPVVTTHTPPPAPPPPPPPPPPHLHRIHPPTPTAQKRSASAATVANPLLGSALTAPKRKRGRPRKLSGSSGGTPTNLPGGDTPVAVRNQSQPLIDGNGELDPPIKIAQAPDSIVQGSPELLEVKFQHSPAATPASSTVQRPSEGENGHGPSNVPSPEDEKLSSKDGSVQQVKEEPEPTPGPSSQDPGQSFSQSSDGTRDPTESFALDSTIESTDEQPSITFELCKNNAAFHHSGGHVSVRDSEAISQELKISCLEDALPEATAGVHFLSSEGADEESRGCIVVTRCDETDTDELLSEAAAAVAAGVSFGIGAGAGVVRGKHDLLEYQPQDDGTVVCKWCGEILPSRTHWYRHKYKMHVPTTVPSPANLLKCHRCNVFFKSRRGYAGHLAARHSEEDSASGGGGIGSEGVAECSDSGDGSSIGACGTVSSGGGGSGGGGVSSNAGTTSRKKGSKSEIDVPWAADYKKQREREEKLVADIIDRVRRECEAQGATVTRRGYSRRTTVMNS